MNANLYRNHETALTDDELLLFDGLFNAWVTPSMLSQGRFELLFNARPHRLSDRELSKAIERWLERGFAVRCSSTLKGEHYLKLTEAGGRLWELERKPDWSRFGSDRYKGLQNGVEVMSFVSLSAGCRDEFMTTWLPANARWRPWTIRSHDLVYWRMFPQLFVGTAAYPRKAGIRPEDIRDWWAEVERKRTWCATRENCSDLSRKMLASRRWRAGKLSLAVLPASARLPHW